MAPRPGPHRAAIRRRLKELRRLGDRSNLTIQLVKYIRIELNLGLGEALAAVKNATTLEERQEMPPMRNNQSEPEKEAVSPLKLVVTNTSSGASWPERQEERRVEATLAEVERFRSHCAVEAMKIELARTPSRQRLGDDDPEQIARESFRLANAMVHERFKHTNKK